jgi:hypothetical protein
MLKTEFTEPMLATDNVEPMLKTERTEPTDKMLMNPAIDSTLAQANELSAEHNERRLFQLKILRNGMNT